MCCIPCLLRFSDEAVLKDLENIIETGATNEFPLYTIGAMYCMFLYCAGANGEACQTAAKKILGLYRDWFNNIITGKMIFNRKKFSDMCDYMIAYDKVIKKSDFLNSTEDAVEIIKRIEDCLKTDLKPKSRSRIKAGIASIFVAILAFGIYSLY